MAADQPDAIGLSRAVASTARPARAHPLANRNFRLLWMGENVSLLGDQFYFVALPWLVFQITGSSLAFGALLMVGGIPRALLMLIGGVITDRFSPRAVMITSNLLRLVITVLLTLVVAGQAIHLWMLFLIAFCFGSVDAFFHPAYRAMIPVIVDEDDLRASNSLMLSASQTVQIAGPSVAGVLVYSVGVMLSFAFDALTFVFTSVTLLLMRPTALPQDLPQKKKRADPEAPQNRIGILTEIGEMLGFVRRNPQLRTIILVVAAINLLFSGPLIVGTATLGRVRFVEGSAAFGAMLSAFGVGMLIGTLAAGVIRPRRPAMICLLLVAAEGVFLVGVAHAVTLATACVLLVLIGVGAGFGNVNVVTLTQKNVSKAMMGRVMSLIVLAEVGLTPVSNALAGALADWNVTLMFVLAGGLLTLTTLLALLVPEVRVIEE